MLLGSKININEIKSSLFEKNKTGFLIKGILYSGYNSILLIPILINFKSYINNKKQIKNIALISTIIIFILASIIFISLTKVDVNINKLDMPTVYAIANLFKKFKVVYSFVILRVNFYYCNIICNKLFKKQCKESKKIQKSMFYYMCISFFFIYYRIFKFSKYNISNVWIFRYDTNGIYSK